jgi:hypothetical protein
VKEIYRTQPEGCVVQGQETKVCKLVKSSNELKQAPKQWHKKFNQILTSDEFSHTNVDKCVYTKSLNDDCVIIYLYVDNMLIFRICDNILKQKKKLHCVTT